jgi:rod shape-determining protein MreB
MLAKHIGVDLGTVNVLVWVKGKGIILQEPSVVAIAVHDNKIVAVGAEAREMLGRTPETIEVARPLRDGVIADYVVTEAMLRYFIEKVAGRLRLFKPMIAISVPVGVTSVESRAVHDAAIQAGGREAYLIPEPLAAALGAGMPVDTPTGNLVVDIGGGTSEAAVIAMNGIVEFASVRVGGNRIDEAVISYVKRKYNLMIGEATAEAVKIGIGSALPQEEEMSIEVRGRDTEAIAEPLSSIVGVVKSVLEKTPPELASDVIDRGIVMTGGGALLRDFHTLLTKETGVPCYVADNPMACVALGAGKALEDYEVIKRSLPAY